MYFTGFLKERLIFYDFFAQLKSGRVYMLMAVSGLRPVHTRHNLNAYLIRYWMMLVN